MDSRHQLRGLEEAKDYGVGWGASTLPFIDCPSGGRSAKSEAREAGDSPSFDSEEDVAILPSGCERGSSSSKRRGKYMGA